MLVLATTLSVEADDNSRDILVTFDNSGATKTASAGTPYRFRKRYSMSSAVRRNASAVSTDHGLVEVDDWPIRSLSIYCFVFRVREDADIETVLADLRTDERVESAQAMNQFKTTTNDSISYDDTYAGLQSALTTLDISSAHSHSRGRGVRIAIIDSHADVTHEDLRGRLSSVSVFSASDAHPDRSHGTAIASVIGAATNNAKGIVGIAPEAELELLVSCWAKAAGKGAICDTFSLAKALDAVAQNRPAIVNMSLVGPYDPLLHRLIERVHDAGVVLVAAAGNDVQQSGFPANVEEVIAVSGSRQHDSPKGWRVHAPSEQIMVAIPDGGYDFQSGDSIAAAHISGVVALLLSASPHVQPASVPSLLRDSQMPVGVDAVSVDACRLLHLADSSVTCAAVNARAVN